MWLLWLKHRDGDNTGGLKGLSLREPAEAGEDQVTDSCVYSMLGHIYHEAIEADAVGLLPATGSS